jgi:hypothetical protein
VDPAAAIGHRRWIALLLATPLRKPEESAPGIGQRIPAVIGVVRFLMPVEKLPPPLADFLRPGFISAVFDNTCSPPSQAGRL